MLTQMTDSLIEQMPSLSARRTTSAKWYIISRWNQAHDEPIDENAVTIFLCDERLGALTEEQRKFAKARKAEIYGSFAFAVLDLFLYREMFQQDLVSGLDDFWTVTACRKSAEDTVPFPPPDRL